MSEPTELHDYVQLPDTSFAWEQRNALQRSRTTITTLRLTSQVWQGLTWTHRMEVFVPERMPHPGPVLLYITAEGGVVDTQLGVYLAETTGYVCAFLYNVPNQPLFDGLVEDALIAHTFVNYLDTGEPTWPLLLPMVKSAIRAMDAVQEFGRQQGGFTAERFVVSGASKRGWTTWLTAAVDARVAAIIPLVYDNLNIPAQLPHQIEASGGFSDRISDYTEAGLPERTRTPEGRHLVQIVDPYTYRDRLTLPKLIINGSNDSYWMTDALNLYWDALSEPKHVLYVPNAGHSLTDADRLLQTITAFMRAQAAGSALPAFSWLFTEERGYVRLELSSDATIQAARCWAAHASGLDFRNSRWTSVLMSSDRDVNTSWTVEVMRPKSGNMALFGEVEFIQGDQPFSLSTQMYIAKEKLSL